LPPVTEPDALRAAVQEQMAIWQFGTRRIAADQNGLIATFIARWLGHDPNFHPGAIWLEQVRAGTIQAVQEEARKHLAAWDPEGYGAYLARHTAEREAKVAEMEARLAAARATG
jgi:hypothetical protein